MDPILTLNADGIVTNEEWYSAGQLHRVDGPAYRKWAVVNGHPVLIREVWMLEGQRHRADGPAYRRWAVVNGVPVSTCEGWWFKGQRHRVDGPAYREWSLSELVTEGWWLYGKRVDPATLHRAVSTINHWLRYHTKRRERVISSLLTRAGMTVFPGLMGLLRSY